MPEWAELAEAHARWERAGAPGLGEGSARGRRSAAFTQWAQRRGVIEPEDGFAAAAAALVVLRPVRRPAAAPEKVWEPLRQELVALAAAGVATNPLDVTLAYGCGWRRPLDLAAGGWWGHWPAAFGELLAECRSSLFVTKRLLDDLGVVELDRDDLQELPAAIAASLLGLCDCGHHLRPCRGNCGLPCCFPRHDLRSWQPEEGVHLRPFVDQAVRGLAQKTLLGAAFAESILYRILERESRVLCRSVEFVRCSGCGGAFEGDRCPSQGCGRSAAGAVRFARKNRLIRPEQEGGRHREAARWVCEDAECATLYPVALSRGRVLPAGPCPRCGWRPAPGRRPAQRSVWVRVAPVRIVEEAGRAW
ncbi:MAG: hypothetical protein ACKVWR_13700 [Acidimicrobiales bacterium]